MAQPHKGIPMPLHYLEMMRHYSPTLPVQNIRQAWLHNATPTELRRYLERISA